MNMEFTWLDWLLVLTVAVMGTVMAYVRHPRYKAFLSLLPVPFTLATLSLEQPVDVTHVFGLLTLLLFTFLVYALYIKLRISILVSIVISAIVYCILGWLLAGVLPKTGKAFQVVSVGVCLLGAWLNYVLDHPAEPAARTGLPVWLKFLAIMAVISAVVLLKKQLQGFMTVFPMLGVIIAYEARHSLFTVLRHIPVTMLTLTALMTTTYVLQDRLGLPLALAVGWVVYLLAVPCFVLPLWNRYKREIKNN
jgi:hypothetical protein